MEITEDYIISDIIGESPATGNFWVLASPVPGDADFLVPKDAPMEVLLGWSPWVPMIGARVKVSTEHAY